LNQCKGFHETWYEHRAIRDNSTFNNTNMAVVRTCAGSGNASYFTRKVQKFCVIIDLCNIYSYC